jgi:glucose-1-phosphate thymidylyltransferase
MVVDARVEEGRGHRASRMTALEHVANRPIMHHVLDGLFAASASNVIVAGEADALIDVRAGLLDYRGPQLDRVDYALCRDGVDLASTLRAAAPLVGDAACLIQPADGLLDAPLPPLDDLLSAGAPDLLLFVDSEDGGSSATAHRGGRVATERRVERRSAEIALFAPGALGRAADAVRCEAAADLSAAGQRLAADGACVHVRPVGGWRRYRGDGHDLLALNRVALDRIAACVPASLARHNRVEGAVLVDPTADVRDSVIIGPTVIGPHATVNESYIGPYMSVGAGARIEGTEIERSIVAPGASIMHAGSRLVSSLIGRDTRVFRDFSLPRALRLWVGDGDEVALC